MFTDSFNSKKADKIIWKEFVLSRPSYETILTAPGDELNTADKCESYCRRILDLPNNLRVPGLKMLQDSGPKP